MRFSEWQEKLHKEHAKVSGIPLAEVTEAMFLEGSSIIVSIGKRYSAEKNGIVFNIQNLRVFYTHHKDEFANLLESIAGQAKVIAEITDILVEAVTSDSMPEILMDRLQGKQGVQNSTELVHTLAQRRLQELFDIFNQRGYATSQFAVELEVAGKTLFFSQSPSIQWGSLVAYEHSQRTSDPVECLLFLSNFETIKAKVEQISGALQRFVKQIK